MAIPKDLVVLRNGEAVGGELQHDKVRIKTAFATIEVEKDKLHRIHFKHPSGTGFPHQDTVLTENGDELFGEILDMDEIKLKLNINNQTIFIQKDLVHSLVFLGEL